MNSAQAAVMNRRAFLRTLGLGLAATQVPLPRYILNPAWFDAPGDIVCFMEPHWSVWLRPREKNPWFSLLEKKPFPANMGLTTRRVVRY